MIGSGRKSTMKMKEVRMNLTLWNPFFAPVTGSPFRGLLQSMFEDDRWNNETLVPAVDVRETDTSYELIAELPGFSKDDLKLEVKDGVLMLSAERNEKKEENDGYLRVERRSGMFSRSWTLPEGTKVEDIGAHYENGVLTLTIPKAEAAKPRQISIH